MTTSVADRLLIAMLNSPFVPTSMSTSPTVKPDTGSSKLKVKTTFFSEFAAAVMATVGGVVSSLPVGEPALPPPPQAAIKADAAKAAQVGLNNLKWCFMIVSMWWVRNRKRFQLRG
jgi:hypothetical protein